jgi:hypothetical protein
MKILSVTLVNRDVIIFDADGAQYYERYKNKQRVIVGKTVSGKNIAIPLAEVRLARLDDDESKTNVSVFFPTVLIIGLVAAMSH